MGTRLTKKLLQQGYSVRHLSRSVEGNEEIPTFKYDYVNDYIDPAALDGVDHVIHLAGAGLAEEQWSVDYKKEIVDSRVKTLELVTRKFESKGIYPKSLISASGVNYYGEEGADKVFVESDPRGKGFLPKVCEVWERAALSFQKKTRVVVLRTGVVLAGEGGVLEKFATPIKFYVGAPLGNGSQSMPWIHIDDLVNMYIFSMENQISGVFNAVAPQHITNRQLVRSIARAMGKFAFLPGVPEWILKLFYGEMADIMLQGNKVSSEMIISQGYHFNFPTVEEALDQIYRPDLVFSLKQSRSQAV